MNTIRFNSQVWLIPLMRKHECNGITKCKKLNTVEDAQISLDDFDMTRDDILYLDDIVIQDAEYTIKLDKPLRNAVYFVIHKIGGTKLRELIWLISRLYKTIYQIEARTTPTSNITLDYTCLSCDDTPIELKDVQGSDDSCSICFEQLTESVVQTPCSHSFHSKCINEWIRVSSRATCPMCRSTLRMCQHCDNTGFFTYTETFTEVPIELSRMLTGMVVRNTTDGVYGIHTYFFNQLILHGLQYNRTTKTVSMSIT